MEDNFKVGILGAGTWGITLARMLSNHGRKVVVWSALAHEVENLSANRSHPNLPDMVIPSEVEFTADLQTACAGKDVVVFAVPSVYVRETARKVAKFICNGQVVVDVAKGIEPDTLMTMSQIINDEFAAAGVEAKVVALSGPTHAEEVAQDMPTAIVAAGTEIETPTYVQSVFMNENFKVYTSKDILGVELSGALKNIIALGVGISYGLGYGDNARAALITGGMEEIKRIGIAMGYRERTFYGLTGIGDLIVTASSRHSRNNKFGYLVGKGMSPRDALVEVGMVVEGVNALPAAMQLRAKYNLTAHIIEAVNDVVNGGLDAREAGQRLMSII